MQVALFSVASNTDVRVCYDLSARDLYCRLYIKINRHPSTKHTPRCLFSPRTLSRFASGKEDENLQVGVGSGGPLWMTTTRVTAVVWW